MRELKFRAWDKLDKEFTHNIDCLLDISVPERVFVLDDEGGELIIEQYTGLKDKNGKEIYEGDIVEQFVCGVKTFKDKPCGRRTIWQVRWNEEECCFELHYLSGSLFGDSLMNKDDEFEVIGNIHENPELLEEKE